MTRQLTPEDRAALQKIFERIFWFMFVLVVICCVVYGWRAS